MKNMKIKRISQKQILNFLNKSPFVLFVYNLQGQIVFERYFAAQNYQERIQQIIDQIVSENKFIEFDHWQTKNISINNEFFELSIRVDEEYIIVWLQPVTKKLHIIEQIRKNILRDRAFYYIEKFRGVQTREEKQRLIGIVNNLETIVFMIDSEFNILMGNSKKPFRQCFEFFQRQEPCVDCILMNRKFLSSHELSTGGQVEFYTEKRLKLDDETHVITIENTTKEVTLLRSIQNQQKLLNHQKEIFQLLSQLSLDFVNITDLNQLLSFASKKITVFFNIQKFSVILHNARGAIYQEELVGFNKNPAHLDKEDLAPFIASLSSLEIIPLKKGSDIVGTVMYENNQADESLNSFMIIFSDHLITFIENIKLQKRLEEMANMDSLTEFFNRNYLEKNIGTYYENSKKFDQPLGIMLIDINGLKRINDLFGHQYGDQLIQQAAKIIRSSLRETDIRIRLGGDEFLIVVLATSSQSILCISEKIKDLSGAHNMVINEEKHPICFSLGSALSTEVDNYQDLYLLADKRMYQDKKDFYKSHEKYR